MISRAGPALLSWERKSPETEKSSKRDLQICYTTRGEENIKMFRTMFLWRRHHDGEVITSASQPIGHQYEPNVIMASLCGICMFSLCTSTCDSKTPIGVNVSLNDMHWDPEHIRILLEWSTYENKNVRVRQPGDYPDFNPQDPSTKSR